jgi:peptidylprolyl isomerase
MSFSVRRSLTVIALFALALPLAACATTDEGTASATNDQCTPTASGAASEAITASGDFGTAPSLEYDTPLPSADATQVSVLIAGDGETTQDGQSIVIEYTIQNGTTGEDLDATAYTGEETALTLPLDEASLLPGFFAGLQCQPIGSRLAIVIPPADAWGSTGNADLGVGASDSLLLVADLLAIDALPVPADWTENVPTVEWDGDMPTVTIPDAAASEELELTVLKEGDGEVVPDGATVTVDYMGVNWATGEVFDESYSAEPAQFQVGGVVEGFAAAIVGQKVGSQVLVTIPPSLAYGEESETNSSELAGQTLVFLIDIISIDTATE